MTAALTAFSPAVRAWFVDAFGEPTPPQSESWPPIQRGEHTLILAPTGSGKTLAAFLWGIDRLVRADERAEERADEPAEAASESASGLPPAKGVRLLYVSPLKALNNDIERNLRVPLRGIRRAARRLGAPVPTVRVAVRSGDTPARDRRAAVKHPPDILITTPESLYLLLTSPSARETLRTVSTVIIDEVHTLVGEKRGVHLAVSLERLEALTARSPQRIGCSATIRPLEEAARFLGGAHWGGGDRLVPRPVTIVDAGYRKPLDLRVETVAPDFRHLEGGSVWPAVMERVADLVRSHDTTLVFANSRRLAERTADRLTEALAGPDATPGIAGGGDHFVEPEGGGAGSSVVPGSVEGVGVSGGSRLLEGGVAKGVGMFAAGTGTRPNPIRAHHGSMSRESRLRMEADLKSGVLPALVGTSSLELGIDMGSVDLVVQLQSPKGIAQGLQRVGRSGHLVGQTSKGRIFTTHVEDVMEAAVIAGGMSRGEVEATSSPRNCLDVLAQQVVAMVSVEDWDTDRLYRVVRGAYPYADLTTRAFHSVLDMLSGRYPSESHASLKPRVAWDRVNDRLHALPGARLAAVTNGGTIPDRGAFAAYLPDGKTRIGELDEEFVFETRVGDAFMLGSQVWRVLRITDDRVTVAEAPGATPRMPFWHGDLPWRRHELGLSVGRFRREIAAGLEAFRDTVGSSSVFEALERRGHPQLGELAERIRRDYALDETSARHVLGYVGAQLDRAGAISSDRTVIVELFDDALGDPRMVVQSPFGGRVHGPWALALAGMLRERLGRDVEAMAGDDGILLRIPDADDGFPVDALTDLTAAEAKERVLAELADSAVFGARFRQNAARALLLPGRGGGRRTPFWLQRLRAKELMQAVKPFPEFPIVAETYRECLEDVMDLPHLEEVLEGIQTGAIHVVTVESFVPSPVAEALLRDFVHSYMYEWDAPKAEKGLQALSISRELLGDILHDVSLDELLTPRALREVRGREQRTAAGWRARSVDELAVVIEALGDLTPAEVVERTTGDPVAWLEHLQRVGRVVLLREAGGTTGESRWVTSEMAADYRRAFSSSQGADHGAPESDVDHGASASDLAAVVADEARRRILERHLRHAGPVTEAGLRARYGFEGAWLRRELERLVDARRIARGRVSKGSEAEEYADIRFLEQAHRRTMSLLRREARPVPFPVYAHLQVRRHHVGPHDRLLGAAGVRKVLTELRGLPLPATVWERDVLAVRVADYHGGLLEALTDGGELVWRVTGAGDPRRARVRFFFRGEGAAVQDAPVAESATPGVEGPDPAGSEPAQRVREELRGRGALFFADLVTASGLPAPDVERALAELTLNGEVTNDKLGALRRILRGGERGRITGRGRDFGSTLEQELALRRNREGVAETGRIPRVSASSPVVGRRTSRSTYRAAKQRVSRRLAAEGTADLVGRWSLLSDAGVVGAPMDADAQAEWRARVLLERHGVVSRAALESEDPSWEWGPVLRRLQLLEMRGAVRRGYFVRGLPGIQFALPEVVEQLRGLAAQAQETARDGDASVVVLNACDPANLYGRRGRGGAPAADEALVRNTSGRPLAFARIPSTWIVLNAGLPVLVAEGNGRRLTTVEGVADELLGAALTALLDHLRAFRTRVRIESWDGLPPREGVAADLLLAAVRAQDGFLVL